MEAPIHPEDPTPTPAPPPREPTPEDLATRDFATELATLALEHKARDLSILDMSGLIDYADVFVICSASNRRQVRAIADSLLYEVKHRHDRLPAGVEGLEASRWILVDFGDVVVHVFDRPLRGFYDLDRLWGDAEPLPTPEVELDEEDDEEDFFF